MTLEQHELILELTAAGQSVEAIAGQLGRSVEAIKRVAGERAAEQPAECPANFDLNIDEVVDFLSNLPEEGLQEVCQLASLQRQTWQLRNQLLARLNHGRKANLV